MSNIDSVLTRVYCLSQEAHRTVHNLRVYPHVAKNSCSYQLCEHLKELNIKTLRAFKAIQSHSLEKDIRCYFQEMLSEFSCVQETYGTLVKTIFLPPDHTLIRKLKSEIDSILLMLSKLTQILYNIKTYNSGKLRNTPV